MMFAGIVVDWVRAHSPSQFNYRCLHQCNRKQPNQEREQRNNELHHPGAGRHGGGHAGRHGGGHAGRHGGGHAGRHGGGHAGRHGGGHAGSGSRVRNSGSRVAEAARGRVAATSAVATRGGNSGSGGRVRERAHGLVAATGTVAARGGNGRRRVVERARCVLEAATSTVATRGVINGMEVVSGGELGELVLLESCLVLIESIRELRIELIVLDDGSNLGLDLLRGLLGGHDWLGGSSEL